MRPKRARRREASASWPFAFLALPPHQRPVAPRQREAQHGRSPCSRRRQRLPAPQYQPRGGEHAAHAPEQILPRDAGGEDRRADRGAVCHQSEGRRANGTINRELGLLIKVLRLALRNRKLAYLPAIDKLKEAAPRQGFFEDAHYEAVRRQLPDDVQVALAIAHTYGWRMQSEVLMLSRRQLDLANRARRASLDRL